MAEDVKNIIESVGSLRIQSNNYTCDTRDCPGLITMRLYSIAIPSIGIY
jgi:hypothetical protein